MRKVFQNELLQNYFEKNGYVKIQLLDKAQINVLTQLYIDLTKDDTPNGFFSTLVESTATKKLLHQRFHQQFSHLFSTLLVDYKSVSSNFITKKSADSKIIFHQDWSFIDESTGKCSLNIWCPLVETFHENGNLAVVPGSHNLQHPLRTSNQHYSPYDRYQDCFKKWSVELPTAAGEAIIFDNALVHGSAPNICGTNRLTASLLGIPEEEQIVIHHLSEDRKFISLYKVNDDYLLNYNPFADVPSEEFLYKRIPFVPHADPLSEINELDKSLNSSTDLNIIPVESSNKPSTDHRLNTRLSGALKMLRSKLEKL